LGDHNSVSCAGGIDCRGQNVDLGAKAYSVKALGRCVEHDHIWAKVVPIEDGKKAQTGRDVTQPLVTPHACPHKGGLVTDPFPVGDSRLGVEHVEAKFWDALIGQGEESLGDREISRGNNSGICRKTGENRFELFYRDNSHRMRIAREHLYLY
jgi:hypothetical protein